MDQEYIIRFRFRKMVEGKHLTRREKQALNADPIPHSVMKEMCEFYTNTFVNDISYKLTEMKEE
jgi:hypothetical protein